MDENRFIEAIPPLKQAINLNSKNTDAHYSLGLVYGNLNRYQEAQNQYRQVLQIDPKHSGAYAKLALTKQRLERTTVSAQKDIFPKKSGIILVP